MIAKIGKGEDFAGLARYLTKGERGQVLDMRNLASADPSAAAGEMQVAAAVSTRCRKPVMHITVSYDPSDKAPSEGDMKADAAEVLAALGLADNQAMIIKHSDRDHAHFHIAANRVSADGKAVSDSQSYPRAEAALRRIEARRALTVTEGRHALSPITGARMSGPRGVADPRQHQVPSSVKQSLLTSQNWGDLRRGLKRDGWRLETVQHGKRPAGAVLVGPDGQRIAAGRVDRGATLARLRARLGPEHPSRSTYPVSARAMVKRPAALAKPNGDRRRKKPDRAGLQIKDVARIGSEISTELVGAIIKAAAPRGGLIGATRKSGTRKKRHGLSGPGI